MRLAAVCRIWDLITRYCCRTLFLTMMLLPVVLLFATMGCITGRLGLAFVHLPLSSSTFLLLLSSGLGGYGSVPIRGHVQMPSSFRNYSLGLVVLRGLLRAEPWVLAWSLPLYGLGFSCLLFGWRLLLGCLLICLASQGGNPPPYL